MRLALIGQSVFGAEVYSLLRRQGNRIVGVFTVPDKAGREDPLATAAARHGTLSSSSQVAAEEGWRLQVATSHRE